MQTPPDWTTTDEEHLLHCRVFDVHKANAISPRTGAAHSFFRIVAGDWVNVIPITADDKVVMVQQYRHGSRDVTLEIPGGMVDPGETPEQAGARELREETGYAASVLEFIGKVNPNPALFGNHCHTFLARDARQVDEIRNEGAEETHVVTVPLAAISDVVRRGEITHALVVTAFHWLALQRE